MTAPTKKKEPKSEPTYETRDVVLAKLRGYPAWPAMIVDAETIPASVKRERPKATKTKFYCVRFFPAGDHAWSMAKDMSKLQKHEIEAYIADPSKKSGDLLNGYKIALNPSEWEERLAAAREEQEAEDEAEEVDQLGEDGEGSKAKGKKRKRESEAGDKKKVSVKKSAAGKSSKVDGKAAAAKKRGKKGKSSEMIESEDDGGDDDDAEGEGDDEEAPPPAKKSKKDKEEDDADDPYANDPEAKKIKDWRHKLQRAFLREGNPPAEKVLKEMPTHDETFKGVEGYQGMTVEYLSYTKIGKVMRKISVLPAESIPRDSEFKFKDRALVLLGKWQDIANAKGDKGAVDGEKKSDKKSDDDKAEGDKKSDEEKTGDKDKPVVDGEGMDVDHPTTTKVDDVMDTTS